MDNLCRFYLHWTPTKYKKNLSTLVGHSYRVIRHLDQAMFSSDAPLVAPAASSHLVPGPGSASQPTRPAEKAWGEMGRDRKSCNYTLDASPVLSCWHGYRCTGWKAKTSALTAQSGLKKTSLNSWCSNGEGLIGLTTLIHNLNILFL